VSATFLSALLCIFSEQLVSQVAAVLHLSALSALDRPAKAACVSVEMTASGMLPTARIPGVDAVDNFFFSEAYHPLAAN
jgi:hypothetical protein